MKRATSGLHVFYLYVSYSFIYIHDAVAPSNFKTYFIMEKMEFIKYDAPQVEVIEVEVEKGFAVSNGGDGGTTPDMDI